ncbi:hypothetical protein C8R44DRAFT_735704 [Mycena epipterygia]|nr:hypothetical protein C8R44DRAFT_735704 [Mycena epipterygia]
MSAEQLLAKFDLDKFIWKPSTTADGAECLARPLAGAELSEAAVVAAARDAWVFLRYQIPIIATSINVDENDVPMLKYRVPDATQVGEWADRTLRVHRQTSAMNLNQLREELGGQKVPDAEGDQTWMHLIVQNSPSADSLLVQLGFIFHTHHAITDGNGCKIITNQFLAEFAKRLGGAQNGSLQWGKEVGNLTPAILNPTFGHPVYGTLGAEMQNIVESMQNQYGFKPRPADQEWPSARRVELVFSKGESEDLLAHFWDNLNLLFSALKAHAALAMVLMFYNPASPETSQYTMNNFCLVDVRPRLRASYASRHGYPGYALAPPMCRVPVALFLSPEGTPLPLERSVLVKAMEAIRERYAAQRQMAVAYIAQAAEMFVYGMKQGYAANQIPVNQCYMLSSDGKGENILDTTFADERGKASFSLAKFFTSINHPHPAPYFRVSSWQGVIEIGADFNGNLISAEEVEMHLAKWKEFMFHILNESV